MSELYPLRFKEILRNYSFGDRWMVDEFAKQGLPEDHRIGETWEVCDRPGESSEVVNGPLRGRTLHELIERFEDALLGEDIVRRFGLRFPLLIKFLDASNTLGAQVHPDDELARARGLDDCGKTEAWYILRTKPGATIECGNRDGLSHRALVEAIAAGKVRSCMKRYTAGRGDAFLLYAGTMHYSDGGVLLYEIMQNSDVFVGLGPFPDDLVDSEKQRRAAEAAEAVHLDDGADYRAGQVTLHEGANRRTLVLACKHFALERLDLTSSFCLGDSRKRFYVVSQIEGESTILHGDYRESLLPGNSCMLPAALADVTIEPVGRSVVLKAYVPDLVKDVIQPLRRAGVSDHDIAALGGKTSNTSSALRFDL